MFVFSIVAALVAHFVLSSSFLFLFVANGVVAQLLILVCGRGEAVVAEGGGHDWRGDPKIGAI